MTIYADPGASFEASVSNAPTGLVGTIGVQILDGAGGTTVTRSTAGIVEFPAGSGNYQVTLTAPSTRGSYQILWDEGVISPSTTASEQLEVSTSLLVAPTGGFGDLIAQADLLAQMELSSLAGTLSGPLITAASRAIENHCQREFVYPANTVGTVTRTFAVTDSLLVDLAPYDLRGVTQVLIHPESSSPGTLTTSQYRLNPVGGDRKSGTYYRLRLSPLVANVWTSESATDFGEPQISVGGSWGCYADSSYVPYDIKRAAVITVSAWLDRAMAEYGISLEDGAGLRPDPVTTYAIPSAAYSLLQPWRRIGTP